MENAFESSLDFSLRLLGLPSPAIFDNKTKKKDKSNKYSFLIMKEHDTKCKSLKNTQIKKFRICNIFLMNLDMQ